MSSPKGLLPTLTEVIELEPAVDGMPAGPLPLAPDSMPLEMLGREAAGAVPRRAGFGITDEGAQALLQRLQPRLDAWIEARAAALLADAVSDAMAQASRALAREVSAQLPTLAREALEELRREGKS
jgi:hypothetical protein